jgi:hypothetical protein
MGRIADIIGTLATTFRVGKATLDSSGLTVNRTLTLPDKSSVIATSSDLAEYLPLAGGTLTGGIVFATSDGADYSDLSKGIALYTNYGFNTLGNTLGYVVPNGSIHSFHGGGVQINPAGTAGLDINCADSIPWALTITRADLANTIKVYNNAGVWAFNSPITSPSVTETSDIHLKTNIRRDPNRWRGIRRKVEMVLYDRLDGPVDEAGVIAQEVQKFAPEFVHTGKDGILSIHYGKLALACAIDPEPIV